MGLLDRDYMRRSPLRWRQLWWEASRWQRYLWIAALVIGLATCGIFFYEYIRAKLEPGEGDLIVNVNIGTQAELETIPGIGAALANLIIAGRPYSKIEDLERVRGISRDTVESIRPYVKVEGETERR